ncbi:MAG: hypothetical protein NT108_02690 [Candidatus Kaiserbacteria bacterium]|nr:hypothetical protein [Candidatus Kaiserbacteria bacterium]
MNHSISTTRSLIVAVAAGMAVLLAWAWQNVHAALQKGIADGSSMRVSMKTSCAVSEETLGSPHFSGCNSIL